MPFGSRAQCARITRLIQRGIFRVCSDTRTRIPRHFACRGFPADRPASCALSQDTPGPSGHPQAAAAPPGRREAPDGARPRFLGRSESERSADRRRCETRRRLRIGRKRVVTQFDSQSGSQINGTDFGAIPEIFHRRGGASWQRAYRCARCRRHSEASNLVRHGRWHLPRHSEAFRHSRHSHEKLHDAAAYAPDYLSHLDRALLPAGLKGFHAPY